MLAFHAEHGWLARTKNLSNTQLEATVATVPKPAVITHAAAAPLLAAPHPPPERPLHQQASRCVHRHIIRHGKKQRQEKSGWRIDGGGHLASGPLC